MCSAARAGPASGRRAAGIALFISLSAADFGLTWALHRHGGGRVVEGNPVARWWLQQLGWEGLAAYKLAVVLVLLTACAVVAARRPRLADHLLRFACLVVAAVVLYGAYLAGVVWAGTRAAAEDEATLRRLSAQLDDAVERTRSYHRLLHRLADDVAGGRVPLAEAARRLRRTERGTDQSWIDELHREFPGRPVEECLALNVCRMALHHGSCDTPDAHSLADRLATAFTTTYGHEPPATWRRAGTVPPAARYRQRAASGQSPSGPSCADTATPSDRAAPR